MIVRLPRGYRRLEGIKPLAAAHERFADTVSALLSRGTLFDWASQHAERKEYRGRGPVFSAPLPDGGPRVVVRHARRGGLIAPLLGDLYLPPTPALSELMIAAIFARAGVPTPPVVAVATYRAAGVLRRFDVMTIEVEGQDLAAALAAAPTHEARAALVPPVARLLAALLNAGAWHQDLNAKNILLTNSSPGEAQALVLDVDRVRFVPAGDPNVRDANLARLRRSMDKLRTKGALAFDTDDFSLLERLVAQHEADSAAARATALEEKLL